MNRRVIIGAAIAAVLFLLAWYVLLFSPTNDKISVARERKEAADPQLTETRARIDRLRQSQRDEPRLNARREVLRLAIPDQPNLGQLILDINDAAARSGLEFISVAPSPAAVPAPTAPTTATTAAPGPATASGATLPLTEQPAEIRLALSLTGGYIQVLDFMNRVDRLPRIVVFDAVTLNADLTGRLTVALTARAFTQPSGVAGAPTTTSTTSTTAPGGATTTTAPGGATTTTAPGAVTTTTGARP